MKRRLLILCCSLFAVGIAFAQKPYSGDWVIKSNGQLLYKIYDNGKNIRMEVRNEKTGAMEPMILFGKDSLCLIMHASKSYGVFTGEALKKKKKELMGVEIESVTNSEEYEFVKKEVISGLECALYHYTQKETSFATVGGQTRLKEGGQHYDVWISPAIKHPVQKDDPLYIRREVMINIKFGMPSASLFVVPKGYKRMSMDAVMGSLHNMMKSRIDKASEGADKLKELDEATKKEGQTKEEKMQGIIDLFKQMENKKKK